MVEPHHFGWLLTDHAGRGGGAHGSQLGGADGPLYGLSALWGPPDVHLRQRWRLHLQRVRSRLYPLADGSSADGEYQRGKLSELDGNTFQCAAPLVRLPVLLNDDTRGVRARPPNLYRDL